MKKDTDRMAHLQGKWALVTGASSGIGVDFAKILASAGCNLVLVARRMERMETLQKTIMDQHDVRVELISMDLAVEDAPQRLYGNVEALNLSIDVLINNAGVGLFGAFADLDWHAEKRMLTLDLINLVHLTKLFVQPMRARGSGYVLNVSSIGAYQPSPYYGTYSAAKSFVLMFSEALNFELRKSGIKVTALSPGVTATEFIQTAGQKKMSFFQRLTIMKSDKVAQIGIDAMLRGKASVVAGKLNAFNVFLVRLSPRKLATRLAAIFVKLGNKL